MNSYLTITIISGFILFFHFSIMLLGYIGEGNHYRTRRKHAMHVSGVLFFLLGFLLPEWLLLSFSWVDDDDNSEGLNRFQNYIANDLPIWIGQLFFGLTGLIGLERNWNDSLIMEVAIAVGFITFSMMLFLKTKERKRRPMDVTDESFPIPEFKKEGADQVLNRPAVGQVGKVAWTIPAGASGVGLVVFGKGNCLVQFQAVSSLGELPKETVIVVVGYTPDGPIEVADACAIGARQDIPPS